VTGAKLLTERRDGVLILTLNRPEVRNAIDTETAWAISHAVDELEGDPALTAAVLTGAGGTFCAGMDLKAFLAGEKPSVGERGFAGIVERPPAKPVIAAVEGTALAGGFEIVLACDLVVAASDSRFGLPEVKRGLVAAGGGLLRLSRQVPFHLALEWALTGGFAWYRREPRWPWRSAWRRTSPATARWPWPRPSASSPSAGTGPWPRSSSGCGRSAGRSASRPTRARGPWRSRRSARRGGPAGEAASGGDNATIYAHDYLELA